MLITVASGKGGTGKTLVATSMALSLRDKERVQVIDCDVEEPNAHILLKPMFNHQQKVTIPVPEVDDEKCTYCGKCAQVCAFNAIAVLGNHVRRIDRDRLCPRQARRRRGDGSSCNQGGKKAYQQGEAGHW